MCKKLGHFAKCCLLKQINSINTNEEQFNEPCFVIKTIKDNCSSNSWSILIKINEKLLKCHLDTGAEANVMSLNNFKNINNNEMIMSTNVKLKSFSNDVLPVIGKVNFMCQVDSKIVEIEFIIVEMNCQTIIGLATCQKLEFIKRVSLVSYELVVDKFKDVFNGLGYLPNECHIEINKNIMPVIEPPRRISFSLHDRLKQELDRMFIGVIQKVNESSEWVNSIVIVEKKNKSLRVCLDPRNLNKAVRRCHYPIPTFNEIRSKLANAKYFSTLDAQSGFWMIPLDVESSQLCTFGTPFGKYRFTRLPYGISISGALDIPYIKRT